MGKHKKHKHGRRSSSSSSSSSSDSDDHEYKHLPKHERKKMKKWRKDYKKGKIPAGTVPPWRVPGYTPAPGNYPHSGGGIHHNVTNPYPQVPQGGCYPQQPAGYPPPSAGGFTAPGGGYPPPPGGAPGGYPPPPGGAPYNAGGFTNPSGGSGYPPPGSGCPPEPEEGEECEYSTSSGSDYDEEREEELEEREEELEEREEELEEREEELEEREDELEEREEEIEEREDEIEEREEEFEEREEELEEEEEEIEEEEEELEEEEEEEYEEDDEEESKKKHKKKDKKDKKKDKKKDEDDREDALTPPPGDQMPTISLDGVADLYRPTVPPHPDFDPEADAEVLRNAMTGTGTEEQAILELISHRSNSQRQEIELAFKTKYGKDLIEDLNSELSGELRETVMALFKPPAFYDAWSLYEAMEGAGTKDAVLIEILCTRSNQQIQEIKEAYQENYGKSLEEDIISDTSGYFKRLLVACCQGNRNELSADQIQMVLTEGPGSVVDRDLARQDAEKLYAAGEKKFGTDESAFIEVLAVRNIYQLNAMFEEYQQLAGKDILASIDSEMSGHIESGLKAIVRSARNRPEYFAYKLNKAMSRLGTNDGTLIRIIVSRSEIDLADIKVAYETRYGKPLASAIESDTSGDYRRLLLALLRG